MNIPNRASSNHFIFSVCETAGNRSEVSPAIAGRPPDAMKIAAIKKYPNQWPKRERINSSSDTVLFVIRQQPFRTEMVWTKDLLIMRRKKLVVQSAISSASHGDIKIQEKPHFYYFSKRRIGA